MFKFFINTLKIYIFYVQFLLNAEIVHQILTKTKMITKRNIPRIDWGTIHWNIVRVESCAERRPTVGRETIWVSSRRCTAIQARRRGAI